MLTDSGWPSRHHPRLRLGDGLVELLPQPLEVVPRRQRRQAPRRGLWSSPRHLPPQLLVSKGHPLSLCELSSVDKRNAPETHLASLTLKDRAKKTKKYDCLGTNTIKGTQSARAATQAASATSTSTTTTTSTFCTRPSTRAPTTRCWSRATSSAARRARPSALMVLSFPRTRQILVSVVMRSWMGLRTWELVSHVLTPER